MSEHVTIFEMGPRDGLQNEKAMIAPSDKIRLVDMLTACGFHKIEVTSFVSPKWVPQMADAAEVLAGISRAPGVSYAALTPTFVGWKQHIATSVLTFLSPEADDPDSAPNTSFGDRLGDGRAGRLLAVRQQLILFARERTLPPLPRVSRACRRKRAVRDGAYAPSPALPAV